MKEAVQGCEKPQIINSDHSVSLLLTLIWIAFRVYKQPKYLCTARDAP